MFFHTLEIHGLLRWLILLAGLVALGSALAGCGGRKPWDKGARLPGMIYVGLFDLQFLAGIVLYATSPTVKAAWADIGAAMKVRDLRFFAVEHAFGMVVALVLAHLGSVLARKAPTAKASFRRAALYYGLSLLIVLGTIPWWR